MSDSELPADQPQTLAPTLRLSRRGLVLSLLAAMAVGMSVYMVFPDSVGGPPLPVEVRLDRQPADTVGGAGAVITEVVVVTNMSEHQIPKLTLDINGQYLWFRDPPLGIGESLTLPLRVFTDKRSSQRFNPSRYSVEDVTVTGQLPSGARGVSRFEFEGETLVDVR